MNSGNGSALLLNGLAAGHKKLMSEALRITLIFTAVLITLLNCCVFFAVLRKRQLRGNSYYRLVLGLSISDFLVGTSLITAIFGWRQFVACALAITLNFIVQSTSMCQVILICVDRITKLTAVKLPRFYLWVLSAWLLSFIMGVIPILTWGVEGKMYVSCTIENIYGSQYQKFVLYISIYVIFLYSVIVVAFVILLGLMVRITRRRHSIFGRMVSDASNAIPNNAVAPLDMLPIPTVRRELSPSRSRRQLPCAENANIRRSIQLPMTNRRYRQHIRATVTVALIFTVLTVCSLPYMIMIPLMVLLDDFSLSVQTKSSLLYVWQLSSAINPFIYWRLEGFKETIFPCIKI